MNGPDNLWPGLICIPADPYRATRCLSAESADAVIAVNGMQQWCSGSPSILEISLANPLWYQDMLLSLKAWCISRGFASSTEPVFNIFLDF